MDITVDWAQVKGEVVEGVVRDDDGGGGCDDDDDDDDDGDADAAEVDIIRKIVRLRKRGRMC